MSYMDHRLKLSAAIAAGFILAGCAAAGGKSAGNGPSAESNSATASQKIKKYTAEVGLTPRQRFSKALEKLENGEEGQALAELNAYLKAVPNSNSARNLINQISTESSKYFPAEFFTVNLTSGTSLSTLAKKYLGSALKFYALAKYNHISNPSRVNIGQDIKIPLTQLARSQRDKDQAIALEIPADQDIVELDEKEAEQAVTAIEAKQIPVAVTPALPEVTADSLLTELKQLVLNKDYSAAVEKVNELKKLGDLNKQARDFALSALTGRAEEIAATDNVQAAKYYAEAGQLNLTNGDDFAAFEDLKLSTDLDESNQQVMEDMLVLQKEIADKYHREASSAFRRQELDVAIAKWNKVLEVNPNHSNAKLYRAQAIELKERLEQIKKK